MDDDLKKLKAKHSTKTRQQTELQAGIEFLKLLKQHYPLAHEMIFHIPNGGFRGGAEARNLVLSGVKSGVPDYLLPIAKSVTVGNLSIHRHGLFIELKRCTTGDNKKGGRVSKQQLEWKERLEKQGYEVVFAWGAKEALEAVRKYLDL